MIRPICMKYDRGVLCTSLAVSRFILCCLLPCNTCHYLSIADKELVCTTVPVWMEDFSPEETRAICDGSGTCLGTSQMEAQVPSHRQEEDCLTIYAHTIKVEDRAWFKPAVLGDGLCQYWQVLQKQQAVGMNCSSVCRLSSWPPCHLATFPCARGALLPQTGVC